MRGPRKRVPPSRYRRSCACLLVLLAGTAQAADDSAQAKQDAPRGAAMAVRCTEAARCPLFDDVYAATPAFRHALALGLRHGGTQVPDWVKDKLPGGKAHSDAPQAGTASAMLPLRIDERPYLLGRMTDPENPSHRIAALYDAQRGIATVHYVDKDGEPHLLGDDAEILRKVMTDYLNADSPFAQSLSRPDVALPIPVSSQ
ncbi:MAG: hypothetical protein INH12_00130 [Cupriavidus sp.]|uniref:hypothetical protein n=2 Tax=unclassified Cupriavidus TaxID=2640874 RepID=UPI0025BA6EF6|nr:hypothetical protein [Cupriavidus sp.]MCA3183226.1 hypothetical protein [Cupriavidus sp.]MCA3188479.1 hypothetical protein [Cupriavidus sp.]MCA3199469.1 hypothetical protein [Cupriavidus sp.]MCA3206024.1 hypothetical protein [Cupriavidus sp.]